MTMPDGAPQTGQIVWRCPRYARQLGTDFYYSDDPSYLPSPNGPEPGVWHSLDPKALDSVREAIRAAIWASRATNAPAGQANAIMQAIGLVPHEATS